VLWSSCWLPFLGKDHRDSDYIIVIAVIPDVNVLKFTLIVKLLVLLSSFWLLLLVIGCMDNM